MQTVHPEIRFISIYKYGFNIIYYEGKEKNIKKQNKKKTLIRIKSHNINDKLVP